MTDLLQQMQDQIQVWESHNDNRAIFLMCYAMMTENMLRTVDADGFEDSTWVLGLTHRFARYYFDALAEYEAGAKPPVWAVTFETACEQQAHVLQHLMLGVNAHISYDLIFALADSIQDEWASLDTAGREKRYRDYSHVNAVIGATLDAVQDQVFESRSRPMIVVDLAFGRLDEWMIHTLIKHWREQVWGQGIAYVTTAPEQRPTLRQRYTTEAEQRSQAIRGQRGIRGIIDLF